MRIVEIKTTQNVVIEYELAGSTARFLAFFIDILVLLLVSMILGYFTILLSDSFGPESFVILLFYLINIIIYGFYSLISEILLKGQTLGKMAVGLRVIKTDGSELNFKDYFTRWSLRFVDIFLSFGTLAVLTINGSLLGQRVGDMAAGTTVIRIRGIRGFSLNQILSLGNKETYNPVYPGVRNLKEEDVLLIKNTISRYNKYNSEAYKLLISKLFKKIEPYIDRESLPERINLPQQVKVLRQVINDYIVLTR